MSPEEQALLRPLVDVQPAFNIMHVIMNADCYDPAAVAFARMKLRESAKAMRDTAKYIEQKLKESAPKESEGGR